MKGVRIEFKYEDYHLKKINSLTILSYIGMKNNRIRMVLAKCDCGKEKEMQLMSIRNGKSKTCGCSRSATARAKGCHGMNRHPIYTAWISMKYRCYDIRSHNYPRYGAVGVRVCDQWRDSFFNFYEWAKDKWEKGLQLDKDILGDGYLYSPETCCWVTARENIWQQEQTIKYTIGEETKTLSEWCAIFNIKKDTVYKRILRGRAIYEALSEPLKKGRIIN